MSIKDGQTRLAMLDSWTQPFGRVSGQFYLILPGHNTRSRWFFVACFCVRLSVCYLCLLVNITVHSFAASEKGGCLWSWPDKRLFCLSHTELKFTKSNMNTAVGSWWGCFWVVLCPGWWSALYCANFYQITPLFWNERQSKKMVDRNSSLQN